MFRSAVLFAGGRLWFGLGIFTLMLRAASALCVFSAYSYECVFGLVQASLPEYDPLPLLLICCSVLFELFFCVGGRLWFGSGIFALPLCSALVLSSVSGYQGAPEPLTRKRSQAPEPLTRKRSQAASNKCTHKRTLF